MRYVVSTQLIHEDGSIDGETLSERTATHEVDALIDLINRMSVMRPGDALDVTVTAR